MSQPVKLSDTIVGDARLASELCERSIAGQIEYWAQLGRAIEPLLNFPQVMALRKYGQQKSLSECLDAVDSKAGQERLKVFLESQPFPHYEASTTKPGWLVRTDADGTKTLGRFVKREFVTL